MYTAIIAAKQVKGRGGQLNTHPHSRPCLSATVLALVGSTEQAGASCQESGTFCFCFRVGAGGAGGTDTGSGASAITFGAGDTLGDVGGCGDGAAAAGCGDITAGWGDGAAAG